MKKLSKSVFKEMKNSKLQFGGAIFLIFLGVMLFIMLRSSITSIEKSNLTFAEDYVQEDFQFYTSEKLTNEKITLIEEKHQVEMERRLTSDVELDDGKKTLRLFNETTTVDKAYVEKGQLPKEKNEVAISDIFARKNSMEIGDTILLNGEDKEISGFIYLPDYIYPLKNEREIVNNATDFGYGILTEDVFEGLEDSASYYIGKWNKRGSVSDLKESISKEAPVLKWLNSSDNPRISYINTEIKGTKSFSTVLPLFIGVISLMMVVILLKRRLDSEKKQIGTQLSLGYFPREITKAYLFYPLFVGLFGSILGVIAGGLLSVPITKLYTEFFNVPIIKQFGTDFISVLLAILVPTIFLLVTGYIVITKQVSKIPIHLLKPQQIGALENKTRTFRFQPKSFRARFRLKMVVNNLGRVFYLAIGIVFSTILLMYGFVSMNSMDTLMEETYKEGLQYDYGVYYQGLKTSEATENVFTFSETNAVHEGEEEKVQLYGIESSNSTISLQNEKGENLIPNLQDGIIINKVLSYIFNLNEGDPITLKLSTNDESRTFEIVGVAELYTGSLAYMDRHTLNEWNDYPENSYLGEWTSDKPVKMDNIFMIENKKEMMESLESLMGPVRYSIFIMSGLSFVIGLVIITLITNLIVEENTNSISLLKVIGYDDKTISKWMINIYTPVVIIAYCVGVPLAIISIDTLLKSLASETNYVLPVTINIPLFFIGFGIILSSYLVSVSLSKRKLKKVSLQEVLKRQDA
ncbi:ABC transporter permease [Rossellomorea aquimaris]|uniref:ABC transporter permease n=1 Tax=Rossellomorea aquimaris TaxID=189382 RepID=UPI0007D09CCD|nr:ABC transporter permease [Rossellomorea aquimaris]